MQTMGALAYASAIPITPSDTIGVNCKGIYVGGAGNIAIKTQSNAAAITFTAVPVGTILPIMIDVGQVMATGTTATLLIGLS